MSSTLFCNTAITSISSADKIMFWRQLSWLLGIMQVSIAEKELGTNYIARVFEALHKLNLTFTGEPSRNLFLV